MLARTVPPTAWVLLQLERTRRDWGLCVDLQGTGATRPSPPPPYAPEILATLLPPDPLTTGIALIGVVPPAFPIP